MNTELLFQVMSEQEDELEKKTLELIKGIKEDAYTELVERLQEIDTESRLRITFAGQHNAGKSTMVSALTKNSGIPIHANVMTDTTTAYKWGDVYLYDTPGLYAGVKEEHDAAAIKAIRESDLLVFCITSSLFDDLLIENFVDLVYKKNYKCKMILAVNKMSQEDNDFDTLVTNYQRSLNDALMQYGGNLSDFPVVFIDAKDYREGIYDNDPELIAFSHFDTLIETLNAQITEKGLIAKVLTKYNILLDSITSVISSTGTEADKNMGIILKRLNRNIRNYQRKAQQEVQIRNRTLRAEIMDIGDTITDKIGVEDITENDMKIMNMDIEHAVSAATEDIEDALNEISKEFAETMGDVLTSEMGAYVFESISGGKYGANSAVTVNYEGIIMTIDSILKEVGADKNKLQILLQKSGLPSFDAIFQKESTINASKKVSKKETSINPGEKLPQINTFDKVLNGIGIAMAVVDIAANIAELAAEEQRNIEIQKAKEKQHTIISSIASSIVEDIEQQYKRIEQEHIDIIKNDIEHAQMAMIQTAQSNSASITELKSINNEIRTLMEAV